MDKQQNFYTKRSEKGIHQKIPRLTKHGIPRHKQDMGTTIKKTLLLRNEDNDNEIPGRMRTVQDEQKNQRKTTWPAATHRNT